MISTHPIIFNPESTDPSTRYYYLPHYVIPSYANNPFSYQQLIPTNSGTSSSSSSTSTMTQHSNIPPKQSTISPSTIQTAQNLTSLNQQEKDDEEEDLENELQSLQNNNKKSNSGGLGGFLGHSVVLSPTVFHGTPLILGSPLMSHTPILSESLTPQSGFLMGKMPTSPIYFVGADHRK